MIIGTGFAGLLAAIGLQRRHCGDFVLLERNAELGGTWQVNSYPGAEVDVPTSLYSISFIAYPFTKTFAPQSELLAYTNHVIDTFGLRKKAITNQTVTTLTYAEPESLWHVATASGERYTARFVIDASGVLANPHVPHIEGADTFRGPMFHAGHWDHSVSLEGKRVGVIGSGCSAAQITPAIAGKVSRLTLFMGKAQWILPRSDRRYGPTERVLRTLPVIRHLIRLLVFAFYDIRFVAFRRYPGTAAISQLMKGHYRKRLTRQLAQHIRNEGLRRHMLPDYEMGCRRVIPTNTYLPALARANVDVDISGIERITPRGVLARDGKEIPLDVIVYATGCIVQAICAVRRDKRLKAIDARRDLQDAYMAAMRTKLRRTVWQNANCTAFYRKNMTDEVTSLSPEPVTGFILARKWFRLKDYRLLR